MIRLAIVVEGPTEEAFVNQVLLNHLLPLGVAPTPFLIGRRGGNVTVDGLALDMANSLWDFDFVTSLVDFYGFHERGPGKADALENRISEAVDSRIKRSWDQSRIFPYVQRHEFEGLLFSDVGAFSRLRQTSDMVLRELQQIRSRFPTPEDINDNKDTAPSKRIANVIPRYKKRVDGPELASAIGLDKISTECPRFRQWLTHMESLGEQVINDDSPTSPADEKGRR